jgi:hypothetical protein
MNKDAYFIENRTNPTGDIAFFWRKGGGGYTANVDEAERFTEKDANLTIRRAKGSHVLIKHRVADVVARAFRVVNFGELPTDL